jgi:hypothetical protein
MGQLVLEGRSRKCAANIFMYKMVFGLLSKWQDSPTRIKVTENVRRKH